MTKAGRTTHLINSKTSSSRSGVSAGRCHHPVLTGAATLLASVLLEIEPAGLIEVDEGFRRPCVDAKLDPADNPFWIFQKEFEDFVLAARSWVPCLVGERPSFSGCERSPRTERCRPPHHPLQQISPCRLTTKPLGGR